MTSSASIGELKARVRESVDAGLVEWDGFGLDDRDPVARIRGGKTVAEILLESRD